MIKTISPQNLYNLVKGLEYSCNMCEQSVNIWTARMAEFNELKIKLDMTGPLNIGSRDITLEKNLRRAEGKLEAYYEALEKINKMIRIDILGEVE